MMMMLNFTFGKCLSCFVPLVKCFSYLILCCICFLIHCFFWDSDVSQDEAEKLGFEKVSEEFISECKSKATLFKHKKTGCEVMSVSNEDENKVFGIVLRTPP